MTIKDLLQFSISILAAMLGAVSLAWQTIRHFQEKHARELAQQERLARQQLVRITPTNTKFRELSLHHSPPQEWYDEDMEGLY